MRRVYALSTLSDGARIERSRFEALLGGATGWSIETEEDPFLWSFTGSRDERGVRTVVRLEQSPEDLEPTVLGRARGTLILELLPSLPNPSWQAAVLALSSLAGAAWISSVVARWCEQHFPNLVGLVVFAAFLIAWAGLFVGGSAVVELLLSWLAMRRLDRRRLGEQLEAIERELKARAGFNVEDVEPLEDH